MCHQHVETIGSDRDMNLYFYNETLSKEIEQYVITEEQLRFTGTPQENIMLSNSDADRYPILVMENEQLVTFFVLHKNEGVKPYSNNNKAILIRAFSTDFHHQGKGYATMALQQLPDFVKAHFNEINELVLAVNSKNDVAQNLYKKCGYIDEGVRTMGTRGELIVMSYRI